MTLTVILGSTLAVAALAVVSWRLVAYVLDRIELRSYEQMDSAGK